MNSQHTFFTPARGTQHRARLLLAHGAGAPADSPYMEMLAEALSRHGTDVIRFEFPYMAKKRGQARKPAPPRAEALVEHFRTQLDALVPEAAEIPLFIGGKSMGGRVASMLAATADCPGPLAGVLCFGYPFHPPGKPERWRISHLPDLGCPACVIQGTRDAFGRPDEVAAYPEIGRSLTLHWFEGCDHDLWPPKTSGRNQRDLIEEAAALSGAFIDTISQRAPVGA